MKPRAVVVDISVKPAPHAIAGWEAEAVWDDQVTHELGAEPEVAVRQVKATVLEELANDVGAGERELDAVVFRVKE